MLMRKQISVSTFENIPKKRNDTYLKILATEIQRLASKILRYALYVQVDEILQVPSYAWKLLKD
jgi:hypothetical protein